MSNLDPSDKKLIEKKNVLEQRRKNGQAKKITLKDTHVYNNCSELCSRAIKDLCENYPKYEILPKYFPRFIGKWLTLRVVFFVLKDKNALVLAKKTQWHIELLNLAALLYKKR